MIIIDLNKLIELTTLFHLGIAYNMHLQCQTDFSLYHFHLFLDFVKSRRNVERTGDNRWTTWTLEVGSVIDMCILSSNLKSVSGATSFSQLVISPTLCFFFSSPGPGLKHGNARRSKRPEETEEDG